jgi:N-acetylglucosamine malate deacetylase 2
VAGCLREAPPAAGRVPDCGIEARLDSHGRIRMPSSLLLIFAHPDDESVFAAGVACACLDAGGRVALVTATSGEQGKRGNPPVCEAGDLGRVRLAELRDAASILGISHVHAFEYIDRALESAPHDEIRKRLVSVIREERPEVVITFDPNGSNLHPDHVAISRFTSDGVATAADPRWFPDEGPPHRVRRLLWTLPVRPWEVLRRADPACEPGVDFAIDISRWTAQKTAALRAHRSQHLSTDRIFFSKPDALRLLSVELFRQAWGPSLPVRPGADIFEGL